MNNNGQEKLLQPIPPQSFAIDLDKKLFPLKPSPNEALPEKLIPQERLIYLFHEHFNCSQHDHNIKPPLQREDRYLWEADTYRYEFNISMFVKTLAISIVDILGLKLLLYFYYLISGSKFLNNFYRFGIINTAIMIFGWINMLLIIYSIYQKTWIYSNAQSLSYMVGLLFLSIIGAAEMSFMNRKIPPLLETVKLSGESCRMAGCLREVRIQDELKGTILRLNFDASSFFMSFIDHNDAKAVLFPRKLQDSPIKIDVNWLAEPHQQFRKISPPMLVPRFGRKGQRKTSFLADIFVNMEIEEEPEEEPEEEIKEEEDILVSNKPLDQPDLIAAAMRFEYAVFFHKFLTKPSRFDGKKAYAYRYARDILEVYSPDYPYAVFLAAVGVIGTVVVSLMKFDASDLDDISENYAIGYLVKGILLSLNAIVTLATLFLISKGTNLIWNRLCFVKGMTELISEEKPPENTIFRKENPMINIFDFESLRTWASLRMIFMNLNQKRLESISLAISMIVAIQLTTITVLGFFYFTYEEPAQRAFFLQYIIFFGMPTIIYMIFVLLFISIGAQVNNQYQEHIYRLKTLKITIYKLFALYPIFTGEGCIQPSTYLFARGFRYLQGSFEYQEITSALLDERLAKINEAYDTIITELEVEEQHRPLRLLGIPMTDSFAGTVFGTILTVIMIPIGKYLAEITGWD